MARILHVFSTFDAGGPQMRLCRMISHWGQSVHHVIVAHDGRTGAAAFLPPGAHVNIVHDFPFKQGKLPERLFKIGRALRTMPVDLVCTYNWGAMDVVLANRLFAQRPLVHHEEGFGVEEAQKQNGWRVLYRRCAYPGAHTIIVVSRTLERVARDVWKQRRVHYLPNGIDVDSFMPPPQSHVLPDLGEGLVIGTVARLNAVKDIPLLVRAVARLCKTIKTVLVIVGDGPQRDDIRATAAIAGIRDVVLMPGFIPNPERYLGLFDIFALSSKSEQCPLSLLEAMAAGLPCVTTDAGDCREMLSPENAPFVVPIGDEEALVKAFQTFATQPMLRQAVGMANRHKARRDFSFTSMMASYEAIYNRAGESILFPQAAIEAVSR